MAVAPVFIRIPVWLDVAPAPAELRAFLEAIRNRLEHLRRSNEELREALVGDPADVDFQQALEENAGVIVKLEGRLGDMQALIRAAARAEAAGRPVSWVPDAEWAALAPPSSDALVIGLDGDGDGAPSAARPPTAQPGGQGSPPAPAPGEGMYL